MDPKLLRMYSDILNEGPATNPQAQQTGFNWRDPFGRGAAIRAQQGGAPTSVASAPAAGTAAAVRGGRGGTGPVTAPQAAKPTALPGDPNAPAYKKDPSQTKKVGTGASGFPVAGQGGRPTPTPAKDPYAADVAAARKADAARQAAAPAPGTTQDPSGGQGNRAFLPGAAGGAPTAQTTPDQMRTATATTAQSIGATNLQGQDPAGQTTPDQMRTATATTAQSIGATNLQGQDPAQQNTAAPARQGGYAASATGAEGQGGTQAARPAAQGPAVTSSSGAPVTTGSGGVLRSRSDDEIAADMKRPYGQTGPTPAAKPVPDTSAGTGPNLGTGSYFEEELEEEIEESIEEELAEAFYEMLRLSGIQLNEKAPPGAKAERMVKHIKKGYAKDGKLSDKEKSIAFATAWKAKKAGKLDESFRVMTDEEGHTLEHIVNRFKHETKTFLNTGEMSDNLYDALYDYYLDRGDMPYGVAKAREGDPYTWIAARFEADIDGTADVKMPVGKVAGDDTLNELARLAGLSESQVNECGDMGMDTEDRLNVSTNMSSDGTKSVNISAQGEKAEELLSMLKLAGMGDKMPRVSAGADMDHPGAIEIHGTMDADGAEQLARSLRSKLGSDEMMDEDLEEAKKRRKSRYSNTPDEEYQTVASITTQGGDLNRQKKQFANMPKAGDNPMATDYMLDEEFSALLDSVLVKETEAEDEAYKKAKAQDLAVTKIQAGDKNIYTADKGKPPVPMDPVSKPTTFAPGMKR